MVTDPDERVGRQPLILLAGWSPAQFRVAAGLLEKQERVAGPVADVHQADLAVLVANAVAGRGPFRTAGVHVDAAAGVDGVILELAGAPEQRLRRGGAGKDLGHLLARGHVLRAVRRFGAEVVEPNV